MGPDDGLGGSDSWAGPDVGGCPYSWVGPDRGAGPDRWAGPDCWARPDRWAGPDNPCTPLDLHIARQGGLADVRAGDHHNVAPVPFGRHLGPPGTHIGLPHYAHGGGALGDSGRWHLAHILAPDTPHRPVRPQAYNRGPALDLGTLAGEGCPADIWLPYSPVHIPRPDQMDHQTHMSWLLSPKDLVWLHWEGGHLQSVVGVAGVGAPHGSSLPEPAPD